MSLIGSMTTYPARFESAKTAIESIYNQTKRPEFLVINISEEDWDDANKRFIKEVKGSFGDWIVFDKCINLRPGNKIIHTAKKYRESEIATFDDDVRYPEDRVQKLFEKHLEYPENPIAFRVRSVEIKNKKTLSYSLWKFCKDTDGPDQFNFSTAVSGNLYPKDFFSEDFFNIEKYIKISHTADDIWVYFHTLLQKSYFVRAGYEPIPPTVHGSQTTALWKQNVSNNENDKIIRKMEKEYGTIYDLAVNK